MLLTNSYTNAYSVNTVDARVLGYATQMVLGMDRDHLSERMGTTKSMYAEGAERAPAPRDGERFADLTGTTSAQGVCAGSHSSHAGYRLACGGRLDRLAFVPAPQASRVKRFIGQKPVWQQVAARWSA